jgi:hypothetical protein
MAHAPGLRPQNARWRAAHDAERAAQANLLRDVFGNPFRPVTLPEEEAWCGKCGGRDCDHESGDCRCQDCGSAHWVRSRGWLTPQVVEVARECYDRRGDGGLFGPAGLAILADALEIEAGCADAGLLAHLRGAGPHVRGCFALDAILGKD